MRSYVWLPEGVKEVIGPVIVYLGQLVDTLLSYHLWGNLGSHLGTRFLLNVAWLFLPTWGTQNSESWKSATISISWQSLYVSHILESFASTEPHPRLGLAFNLAWLDSFRLYASWCSCLSNLPFCHFSVWIIFSWMPQFILVTGCTDFWSHHDQLTTHIVVPDRPWDRQAIHNSRRHYDQSAKDLVVFDWPQDESAIEDESST